MEVGLIDINLHWFVILHHVPSNTIVRTIGPMIRSEAEATRLEAEEAMDENTNVLLTKLYSVNGDTRF